MITNPYIIDLETTSESNLFGWAASKFAMKQVKIVMSHPSEYDRPRTIELYDTLCVGYDCYFDADNNTPMITRLTLSPAIVTENGELIMEQSWKVTDLNAGSVEATTIQDNSPSIVDSYFTDTQGNNIENYEIGDIIKLVIRSENMLGNPVTVNLEDKDADFEYNGERLPEDTLSDYIIQSNTEQIELTVIEQE